MKCPRCGKAFPRLLALSRKDNTTQVCDRCGNIESIECIEAVTGETDETRFLREYFHLEEPEPFELEEIVTADTMAPRSDRERKMGSRI